MVSTWEGMVKLLLARPQLRIHALHFLNNESIRVVINAPTYKNHIIHTIFCHFPRPVLFRAAIAAYQQRQTNPNHTILLTKKAQVTVSCAFFLSANKRECVNSSPIEHKTKQFVVESLIMIQQHLTFSHPSSLSDFTPTFC